VVVTTKSQFLQLGDDVEHPESVTAILTANEPKDGTILFVRTASAWTVIERDDAVSGDYEPGEHWYVVTDEVIGDADPMSLHEHIKFADAVYAIGEKPAEFGR
jgi:hypothetical protein